MRKTSSHSVSHTPHRSKHNSYENILQPKIPTVLNKTSKQKREMPHRSEQRLKVNNRNVMPENLLQPQSPLNIATDTQIFPLVRNELQKLLSQLDELDSDHRKAVAVQALESLDTKNKKEAIRLAGGLGLPDQPATNFIWKIIIFSFAIVLVGSFVSLAISIVFFQKTPTDAGLQMLLTMFTLVVGFFAGLLSPSPIHKT